MNWSRYLDARFAFALAAPFVACACGGNTNDGKDASPDVVTTCPTSTPTCGCSPTPMTITYTACTDAGMDDGGDGGDGGDAGACFPSCLSACQSKLMFGTCSEQGEDGGVRTATCMRACGVGRRPDGLLCEEEEELGEYFAFAAFMEAASVRAFERLARELEAHGAPKSLIRAAKRAARDERRHAKMMARLSGKHEVPRVRVRSSGRVRSLERIARENAVEGCVGETFGALVLRWQAAHTSSAPLRRALDRIAPDEQRHAALSFAVDAWIRPKLDEKARARIEAARREAIARIGVPQHGKGDASLGLPDRRQARVMADALFSS